MNEFQKLKFANIKNQDFKYFQQGHSIYALILLGDLRLPDTTSIHSWLLWKALAIRCENFSITVNVIIFSRNIGDLNYHIYNHGHRLWETECNNSFYQKLAIAHEN